MTDTVTVVLEDVVSQELTVVQGVSEGDTEPVDDPDWHSDSDADGLPVDTKEAVPKRLVEGEPVLRALPVAERQPELVRETDRRAVGEREVVIVPDRDACRERVVHGDCDALGDALGECVCETLTLAEPLAEERPVSDAQPEGDGEPEEEPEPVTDAHAVAHAEGEREKRTEPEDAREPERDAELERDSDAQLEKVAREGDPLAEVVGLGVRLGAVLGDVDRVPDVVVDSLGCTSTWLAFKPAGAMAMNTGPTSLVLSVSANAELLTLSSADAAHSPLALTLELIAYTEATEFHCPEPDNSRSDTRPGPSGTEPPAVGIGAPTAAPAAALRGDGTEREMSSGAAAPGTSSNRTPRGADAGPSGTHCNKPPTTITTPLRQGSGDGVRVAEAADTSHGGGLRGVSAGSTAQERTTASSGCTAIEPRSKQLSSAALLYLAGGRRRECHCPQERGKGH